MLGQLEALLFQREDMFWVHLDSVESCKTAAYWANCEFYQQLRLPFNRPVINKGKLSLISVRTSGKKQDRQQLDAFWRNMRQYKIKAYDKVHLDQPHRRSMVPL